MASAEVIPIEALLQPISEEQPCGENLRWDPLYSEVKRARAGESNAVDESADVEPDWRFVEQSCLDVLDEKTKDLNFAVWLTEAMTWRHGLAGLRDGMKLISGLCERYWDNIYPFDEDGDVEVRVGPFVGLAAGLPIILRQVPLLPDPRFTLEFRESFTSVPPRGEDESDGEFQKRKSTAEERKADFESAVTAAKREDLLDPFEAATSCLELMKAVDELVTAKTNIEVAPSWSEAIKVMTDVVAFQKRVLAGKGGVPGDEAETGDGELPAGAEGERGGNHDAGGGGPSGPIRSREQAIARLQEVSEFLRRTERHSPVPLLIDRAIRWANKPFTDVLAELVKDEGVMQHIDELLGTHSSPPEE